MLTPAGRRSRRSVDSAGAGESTPAVPAGGETSARTYFLVLVLLSLFAWAPLLYPGYLQVHSGFLPIFNLVDLASGDSPLRWQASLGPSPDVLRSDGPLAYWLGWAFRPLLGEMGAIKAVLALSLVVGGLGMWALIQRIGAGRGHKSSQLDSGLLGIEGDVVARAGLLAGVVYMLWPPLLAAVYVRGALAEVMLMGLLPWALWAVTRLKNTQSGVSGIALGVLLTGLATALLFLAQPGLAIWATVLLVLWSVWPLATASGRIAATVAVILGALAGATGVWALSGMPTSVFGGAVGDGFSAHAVYPYQFLSAAWGFGASSADWRGELPFQLGLAALGLAMLAGILGIQRWARLETPIKGALSFAIGAGLILLLLTTTAVRGLWNWLPMLGQPLTYPWQLLVLVGPLLALAACLVVLVEQRVSALPVWAGLLAFVVLSSYPYLAPRFTKVAPDLETVAIFGGGPITLLSADVQQQSTADPDAEASQASSPELQVTAVWQALQPVDFDYNVFFHAVNDAGDVLAQWDGPPQRSGEPYPMTMWSVGEVISDTYSLELDVPVASVAHVNLGLYNWQTGERLTVTPAAARRDIGTAAGQTDGTVQLELQP